MNRGRARAGVAVRVVAAWSALSLPMACSAGPTVAPAPAAPPTGSAPTGRAGGAVTAAAEPARARTEVRRPAEPRRRTPTGDLLAMGDRGVAALVVDLLRAEAVGWRVFACETLGLLGWRDAEPHLRAALADATPVPGYSAGTTVATFARPALHQLDAARR